MVSKLGLTPINPIVYVSEDGINTIKPECISKEVVGGKAFGLSCLPSQWTLPFIVISDIYLTQFRRADQEERLELLGSLSGKVIDALSFINITEDSDIIIRSSGCSEGMEERGKLHSTRGNVVNFQNNLEESFKMLIQDCDLDNYKIPIIIQKLVTVFSAKGHLSNERRAYEAKRDWLGEFEDAQRNEGHSFTINIRAWRKQLNVQEYFESALKCNLEAHVKKILYIPANWGTQKKLRIHFEWVWDGKNIYLVQADEDCSTKGVNPTKVYQETTGIPPDFVAKRLRLVTEEHGKKYHKIKNVFVYQKLHLPIAKLYILDDQELIRQLASGHVPEDLEDDIKHLVNSSLVIRMDIESDDLSKRQLLPRTQEERSLDGAISWLTEKCADILNKGISENVVFIFHNFIPAISSAFAYAVPGKRKVQIEALWGLPEGLYYNAHDKFIVDTKFSNVEKLNLEKFTVDSTLNYKHFFVSPDKSGHWTTKILKPAFDWKKSIEKDQWINKIALNSRKIAEHEGCPVSVMWFVNVPKEVWPEQVFPWYHEEYDQNITPRIHEFRYKTPFDQLFVIQTVADFRNLKEESQKEKSYIKYIKIQPNEDQLLRNKDTLYEIGKLAKELNAVILLEGGILSHAYYQLLQTDAVVEVLHPFKRSEDKREFNKLVRDKVPHKIKQGGETVNIARLTGEALLKALRDKLIEEAFEVLDAVDEDSIVEELADVCEVINAILANLDVRRDDLSDIQQAKKEKAGGFKDGTILLDTTNPLLETNQQEDGVLFKEQKFEEQNNAPHIINYEDIQNQKVEKLKDRREHNDVVENKITLNIPLLLDNWSVNSTERTLISDSKNKTKIQLKGIRSGTELNLQISIFTNEDTQLKLFE